MVRLPAPRRTQPRATHGDFNLAWMLVFVRWTPEDRSPQGTLHRTVTLDFLCFDAQPAQRDIEAIADDYLAEVTSPAHSMQTLVV